MTSSDDKSIRVWEYGIPVVMKYIADPTMHSMPTVTASPNGNWLAGRRSRTTQLHLLILNWQPFVITHTHPLSQLTLSCCVPLLITQGIAT